MLDVRRIEETDPRSESRFSSPPARGGVAAASADEVVGGRLVSRLAATPAAGKSRRYATGHSPNPNSHSQNKGERPSRPIGRSAIQRDNPLLGGDGSIKPVRPLACLESLSEKLSMTLLSIVDSDGSDEIFL